MAAQQAIVALLSLILSVPLSVPAALPAQTGDNGPPPGKLIDIGGRKLHLHCTGKGEPTVVLEAGASAFAIDWSLVQPEIARTNRVCSYDRAGSGWSDPAGSADADVVADLNALLRAAGEKPPYVMVGASLGGIFVRLYEARYPGEVAGLVLVDPAYEERLFTSLAGQMVTIASLSAEQLRSTIRPGTLNIPRRPPQTGAPFDRLAPATYAVRIELDRRLIASIPATVTYEIRLQAAEAERARLAALRERTLANPHPLGDRPVVVLTRGAGAGHEIHLFEPPAVVQAIHDVVTSAKKKTRLPAR
jgi:pimeloyl-ACP methyl ester carboxylesterase